jgi:hypothetical protein
MTPKAFHAIETLPDAGVLPDRGSRRGVVLAFGVF